MTASFSMNVLRRHEHRQCVHSLFARVLPLVIALGVALPFAYGGASPGWGTNIQTGPQDVADFGPAGMNFKTIRSDARASIIEPTEGTFSWDSTDTRYNILLAAGCDILAVVNGNTPPVWMRATGSTIRPDKDKYAQYVLDVITHYNTGAYASPNNVKYFEIGNEADGMWDDDFGGDDRLTADAYYEILEAVWLKTADFRSANPEVKLIGGVIAGAPVSLRMSTNDYFDQLWTVRGGWQYMDILSFHFYIRRGPPETYYAPELGDPGKGRLWDQVLMPSLAKISDHPLPVWATETGYNLDELSGATGVQLTQEEHAKWMVRAAIIMRGTEYIDRFLQFACYANSSSPGNYGFRDGVGGSKRLSYDAFGTMCKVLDSTVTSIAMVDYYHISSPTTDFCAFEYTKAHGAYGWASWWVPDGSNGDTGTISLGGGAIPATAAIHVRTMSGTTWTPVTNPGTGSIDVVVTDEPLYIEVRPVGSQLSPAFVFDVFAIGDAAVDTAYSGSLVSRVSDPDYSSLAFSKQSGPAWLSVNADGSLAGTPAAGDLGANEFVISVSNAAGASDTARVRIEVKATPPPSPETTISFISPNSNDQGTVIESAEGSGVGGSIGIAGTGPNAMRAGDDAANRQQRAIVTFDTSALPEGVAISSATLRVQRGTVGGTNPFTGWSPAPVLHVDIKGGGFGTSTGLQAADFEAAADQDAVGSLSNALANGDWSEAALSGGLNYINSTGTTQFRLRFSTATNSNGVADFLAWRAGKDPTEANRPQLLVTFNKAVADVTIADLVQIHDDAPKPVTVITAPANLTVDVTYDGAPNPPTAVGSYTVVATVNESGYVGSATGLLTISAPVPPEITADPESLVVNPGQAAIFSVTAAGTAPLSYQWRKDGVAITGATASSYTIAVTQASDAGDYSVVVTNRAGEDTSAAATLVVRIPPEITEQPQDLTIDVGQGATFSVTAAGTAPLSYQWRKNGAAITGATASSYTIAVTQATDAGSYDVVVTNAAGSATSAAATLAVRVPPAITAQPQSLTVNVGQGATFSVTATGTAPLSYQWRKDGAAIAGATASSYTIIDARVPDSGTYTVVVSNVAGSVASAAAELTVVGRPSRLINLTVRAHAGRGDRTLIAGMVLEGTTNHRLLVRGIGPTLPEIEGQPVPNVLADPRLTLYSRINGVLEVNNDWGGTAELTQAFADLGAYMLPAASKDAALLRTVAPGIYTAHVGGPADETGIAMIDIYDADLDEHSTRLVNVSARAYAGVGEEAPIVTFEINGDYPKAVLLRGIGPGLTDYWVTDVVADPHLALYASGSMIAENDNWGGTTLLADAFYATGAFDLPADSKDAAILILLEPGAYMLQFNGVGATTGVGLIEIYDVPDI